MIINALSYEKGSEINTKCLDKCLDKAVKRDVSN